MLDHTDFESTYEMMCFALEVRQIYIPAQIYQTAGVTDVTLHFDLEADRF